MGIDWELKYLIVSVPKDYCESQEEALDNDANGWSARERRRLSMIIRVKKAFRFLSGSLCLWLRFDVAMPATRGLEGSRYDHPPPWKMRKESSVASLRDQNDELRGELMTLLKVCPGVQIFRCGPRSRGFGVPHCCDVE